MRNIAWWPELDSETRAWLIAHNGEAVPSDVFAKIAAACDCVTVDAWWFGETGPDGFHLSDEAVDWIEAQANGEEG